MILIKKCVAFPKCGMSGQVKVPTSGKPGQKWGTRKGVEAFVRIDTPQDRSPYGTRPVNRSILILAELETHDTPIFDVHCECPA